MQNLAQETAESLVTIVVSFRERWRFTPSAVETILRNTPGPFAFWLLDTGMPEHVRTALQPHVNAGKLEIIRIGEGVQPNAARARIVQQLATRYAVFIDNDVMVAPGWLDALVDCAEETGAGIVSPLYLWGTQAETDLIHMAGGDIELSEGENGVGFEEIHRFSTNRLSSVEHQLRRELCDFGEFHCLMMRREVYQGQGVFNPEIVTVHEHIHASLAARELGFSTWFEPASRVNYLAFAPWQAGELPDFRHRWNQDDAECAMRAFAERWGFVDDDTYRNNVREFLVRHVGHVDFLDVRPPAAERRNRIMTRADLQQTFSGLEWMALEYGYTIEEVEILLKSYQIAMNLLNGLYRPCGRPFINHLTGTASVLLFYGCPLRVIAAGMLHAVFSHGMGSQDNPDIHATMAMAADTLGSTGRHALALARQYPFRLQVFEQLGKDGRTMAEYTLDEAELYLLDAANDIDMHLSLEIAVTDRTDVLSGKLHADCVELMHYIGLPGLAATLTEVREKPVSLPLITFRADQHGSFALPAMAQAS